VSLTIALTRYKEPNTLLWDCMASLSTQTDVKARVILLDQMDCRETRVLCDALSGKSMTFDYRVVSVTGCSEARNLAVGLCETEILLWTDPDILAAPDWARILSDVLMANQADIVGGRILPRWHSPPRWYVTTRVMADHYSLMDLGGETRPVDRVIGGSLGMHLGRLGDHARFDLRLGRQSGTLLGGTDAEFCERAMARGFRVCYVGRAVVHHQIPPERVTLKWIARKFYYGGLSRGLRGGRPRPMTKTNKASDYAILTCFAPWYLAGLVSSKRCG